MRLGPLKILLVLAVVWLLLSGVSGFARAKSVSGFTNPIYMPGFDERRCPGCVKQAQKHKNRDLIFAPIDPWQSVDNKVVYY
jgi:hypothetical protein